MRPVILSLVICAACHDPGASPGRDGGGPADLATTAAPTDSGVVASDADLATAPAVPVIGRCGDPAPVGATLADDLPGYAGVCPTLAAAPAQTTITSSGASRKFVVVRPATINAGEKLPVVFFWHWLGGDSGDVLDHLSLQAAVDARHFIAVAPDDKGDILFKWPFGVSQPDDRLDEELRFFDDMLACVASSLPVDKECVSSMGVSAGALMTDQLASRRSNRLASFVSLSGGVDGFARGWTPAPHQHPALVLWGGPGDMYPDNVPLEHFDDASKALESSLGPQGHFVLECVHNCGHALPPFDPPLPDAPPFDLLWRFALDHPFWLPPGASLYQTGLPAAAPSWCAAGVGMATPRAADAVCAP